MITVKLRCGEIYPFNMIKSITDNGNGTVEIVGNTKPRGRYKYVSLYKMTIENWSEIISIFPVIRKPYYCNKCKKMHKDGDVYSKHIDYYGNQEDSIPTDRILKADIKKLKGVGIRQYNRLMERLQKNPDKKEAYIKEINKLLIYEGVITEDV